MVNNFIDMIAGSLNLTEPWYVDGAEFSPETKEVHIYVKVREGAEFVCPRCGGPTVRDGYEPTAYGQRQRTHGE